MKRILFVDDEPNVLQGFKRMLRPKRDKWDIHLSTSARQGLDILAAAADPFDAVISDLRMPGMDGIAFLTEVTKLYPQILRFGLSGSTNGKIVLAAASVAHRFIAKPCDPEDIIDLLASSFELRDRLNNNRLRQILYKTGTVPSLPNLYQQIVNEVQLHGANAASVARIIEKDIGMCSKLLQMVNSVSMGFRHKINGPAQAVSLLGIENIKSIVLMAGVLNHFQHCR